MTLNKSGNYPKNPSAKYHTFLDSNSSPLVDFLDTLSCVEGEYTSYFTKSENEVSEYVRGYLTEFLKASPCSRETVNSLMERFEEFPMRCDYFENEQYRESMVMGTDFFNDFLYASAFRVASKIIPYDLLSNCMVALGYSPSVEQAFASGGFRYLVNLLSDCPKYRFYTDFPDFEFGAEVGAHWGTIRADGMALYCSAHDYENYIRPYILFLSNWWLLLGVYLAVRVFGQCTFTLIWWDSLRGPLSGLSLKRTASHPEGMLVRHSEA